MIAIETGYKFNQYIERGLVPGQWDLGASLRRINQIVGVEFAYQNPRNLRGELEDMPDSESLWVVRDCLVAARHTPDHSQFDLSLVAGDGFTIYQLRDKLHAAVPLTLGRRYHGDDESGVLPLEKIEQKISASAARAVAAHLG